MVKLKHFRVTLFAVMFVLTLVLGSQVQAAENLNVYSIWPENWARPMFQEFEKATGIHVKFIRFSSGEALARVIAEKNNPRVDVLFCDHTSKGYTRGESDKIDVDPRGFFEFLEHGSGPVFRPDGVHIQIFCSLNL